MNRKMTKKTKFMTALSIWMIFLSIGFAIPSIVEGINIAKNYQDYYLRDEVLLPDSYTYVNLLINSKAGINIQIDSIENGSIWQNIPTTLAIMSKDQFIAWGLAGNLEPNIQNSTYLFHRSEIQVDNLRLEINGEYFFIVYNTESLVSEVDIEITVIPWGHITAISIVGFLFAVSILVFIMKILSAAYYNGLVKIKGSTGISENQEITETTSGQSPSGREGKFCQSCGTPLTPKDGQYCPHCGASI